MFTLTRLDGTKVIAHPRDIKSIRWRFAGSSIDFRGRQISVRERPSIVRAKKDGALESIALKRHK